MRDEDVFLVLRNAAARTRGYADYWEWEQDRARAELGVVETLCESLRIDGDASRIVRDPPDVLFVDNRGRRIGIEVTELVDPRAAALNRIALRAGKGAVLAIWTEQNVATELERRIASKDRKLAKSSAQYDELWLAVSTDEPTIDFGMASKACTSARGTAKHLHQGFLLLGYDPGVLDRFPNGIAVLPFAVR